MKTEEHTAKSQKQKESKEVKHGNVDGVNGAEHVGSLLWKQRQKIKRCRVLLLYTCSQGCTASRRKREGGRSDAEADASVCTVTERDTRDLYAIETCRAGCMGGWRVLEIVSLFAK